MESLKKGLIFEGLASAELKDQSGEQVKLEGMDITDLKNGMGVLNYDHKAEPEDIIGKILDAKKILSSDDCENDNQRKFWDQVKSPYLWIKGEIFTEGNESEFRKAKNVASLMKRFSQYGVSPVRLSIEGKTVKRDGENDKVLAETSVSRVAVTIRPCLKETRTEILSDNGVQKSMTELGLNELTKSEFIPDSTPINIEYSRMEMALDAISRLEKSLSVGYGAASAPAERTGVSAIIKGGNIRIKKKKKK